MANWDNDFEAQQLKEYEGRFTVNFKKIYMDVDEINEKTLEVNDKHPKDSLMKLWAVLGYDNCRLTGGVCACYGGAAFCQPGCIWVIIRLVPSFLRRRYCHRL